MPEVGNDPTAYRLSSGCSTTELHGQLITYSILLYTTTKNKYYMNKYCADLNFKFKPFDDNFDITQLKIKAHSRIEAKDINQEFVNLLDNLGLKINMAECFYRKAHSKSGIHRDVTGTDSATKINWVYDGSGSVMDWYRIINNNEKILVTGLGSTYNYYEKEDVELVHSQQIGCPSLLEVALPHGITMGHQERTCISVVIQYKHNDAFPTFAESLNIFKDYIGGVDGT